MLFIIPLALVFLGFIVYLALSKKSSPLVRLAAIIALAVIILAIIVCMIIIFSAQGAEPGAEPVDFITDEPVAPASNNYFSVIFFLVFIIVLLGIVLILSLREQRKSTKEKGGA